MAMALLDDQQRASPCPQHIYTHAARAAQRCASRAERAQGIYIVVRVHAHYVRSCARSAGTGAARRRV